MFKQIMAYNVVGIINTFLGFGIIVSLMLLGYSPEISNMLGYGTGAVLSYYLNSKYTFIQSKRSVAQGLKFFIVLLIAYGLNLIVLKWSLVYLNAYMSQLLAACAYTISSFLLGRFLIFRKDEASV